MFIKEKWTQFKIINVWQKAKIVLGQDPAMYRKDACGAWIQFSQYGNRNSDYGWEVDHIIPVAMNGSDDLRNLRPLHWKNNAAKADGVALKCVVWAR